jgi:hypothetical protein
MNTKFFQFTLNFNKSISLTTKQFNKIMKIMSVDFQNLSATESAESWDGLVPQTG